jgi:tetratricopeptide (TPR) repeat protein
MKEVNIQFEKGRNKLASKNYEGAIKDFNKILEIDPRHTKALKNRARCKHGLGDFKGFTDDYLKAVAIERYLG